MGDSISGTMENQDLTYAILKFNEIQSMIMEENRINWRKCRTSQNKLLKFDLIGDIAIYLKITHIYIMPEYLNIWEENLNT